VVATITNDGDAYAAEVVRRLSAAGLRVALDSSNEKIGYKVREHSLAKVPVLLAIGRKETETRTVAMRRLGSQAQETLALEEAAVRLASEAATPAA
jgi:threonyl-tRNA synthetase